VAALSVVHASMTGGVLLLAGLTFSRRAAA
jgi:hypothetical protein